MAFQPVPNCASVVMRYDKAGQKCENVYHIFVGTSPTVDDLTESANDFLTWEINFGSGIRSNDVVCTGVVVTDLNHEAGIGVEIAPATPIQGDGANPLPNNVTLSVKWSTGLSGRSFRGRTYHIGVDRSETSGNFLVLPSVAGYTARYSALLAATISRGRALVIVSRFHNRVKRDAGVITLVQHCTVDNILDSQRRRLPGRGI